MSALKFVESPSTRESALVASIIGLHCGENNVKLGNEGLMLHYDILVNVAHAFCIKFPLDYDWEQHRDIDGGDDFDIEAINFLNDYVEESNIIISSF